METGKLIKDEDGNLTTLETRSTLNNFAERENLSTCWATWGEAIAYVNAVLEPNPPDDFEDDIVIACDQGRMRGDAGYVTLSDQSIQTLLKCRSFFRLVQLHRPYTGPDDSQRGLSKAPVSQGWQAGPEIDGIDDEIGNGRSNWGVVCGKPSGIVVLDFDTQDAIDWAKATLPETPMIVRTGKRTPDAPNGGEHWYYKRMRDQESRNPIFSTDGNTIKVEIKGEGRQVVAPGSTHPSGYQYELTGEWIDNLNDLPYFQDDWVPEHDSTLVGSTVRKYCIVDGSIPDKADGELDKRLDHTYLADWYRRKGYAIDKGYRNDWLYAATCDYVAENIPTEVAIRELGPQAKESGLDEQEIIRTIESAYRRVGKVEATQKRDFTPITKDPFSPEDSSGGGYMLPTTWVEDVAVDIETANGAWGNVIKEGLITLLSGQEKVGKSTLLHTLLHHRGKGGEFIYPIPLGKTLYLTEEPKSNWETYKYINEFAEKSVSVVFAQDWRVDILKKKADYEQVLNGVGRTAKARGCNVVIFDTYRKFIPLDNYDDAAQVKKALDPIRNILCERFNLAVLLVHHMKKRIDYNNLTAAPAGSHALAAESDILLSFTRPKPLEEKNPKLEDQTPDTGERILTVGGRLVENAQYRCFFDGINNIYTPAGDVDSHILKYIKICDQVPPGEWITTKKACQTIPQQVSYKKTVITDALRWGTTEGYLIRKGSGHKCSEFEYQRTSKTLGEKITAPVVDTEW